MISRDYARERSADAPEVAKQGIYACRHPLSGSMALAAHPATFQFSRSARGQSNKFICDMLDFPFRQVGVNRLRLLAHNLVWILKLVSHVEDRWLDSARIPG